MVQGTDVNSNCSIRCDIWRQIRVLISLNTIQNLQPGVLNHSLHFSDLLVAPWRKRMQVKNQALTYAYTGNPTGCCRSAAPRTSHLSCRLQYAQHASWQDKPQLRKRQITAWEAEGIQVHKSINTLQSIVSACLRRVYLRSDLSVRSKESKSYRQSSSVLNCLVFDGYIDSGSRGNCTLIYSKALYIQKKVKFLFVVQKMSSHLEN